MTVTRTARCATRTCTPSTSLGQEVSAVQRPAAQVGGPLSPDPLDVVGAAGPGLAPQRQHRARQWPGGVGLVMDQVDAGAGAVVLAGGVDGRRGEAPGVL